MEPGIIFSLVDELLKKIFSALNKACEFIIKLDCSLNETEAGFVISQLSRDLALAKPDVSFLLVGNNLNVWVH